MKKRERLFLILTLMHAPSWVRTESLSIATDYSRLQSFLFAHHTRPKHDLKGRRTLVFGEQVRGLS
jgi:hypothetical protein